MSGVDVAKTSLSEGSDRRPVPFRGGGFAPVPRRLLPWIVFLVLIAAWQAASSAGLLPPLFMPSPAAVIDALQVLWTNGTLRPESRRVARPHHSGLDHRHDGGARRRPRHGHLLGRARRRPADRVGAVPDPQDRAAAAAHPVVRHRRAFQGRDHRARRVLPDGDLAPTAPAIRCRATSSAWARASACRPPTSWPRSCCPAPCPASWRASASPPRWRCCCWSRPR